MKPNILEAAELLGRPLSGIPDAAAAAREIVARGAGAAVITLRGEGAVASTAGRAWQVHAPREDVVRCRCLFRRRPCRRDRRLRRRSR